ncbi:MAG: pyridoxal-dependent decarboxylase [Acidimicrobiales bacterium]
MSEPLVPAHMTAEEFRRHGHALVDWVAQYLSGLDDHPVQSRLRPGDVRASLPAHPPRDPEPFESVLRDLDSVVLPGITHWQSPSFFGYFPANASEPSILGELASAGLGIQGMSWATSPVCTELETRVLDWLAEMLGLPDSFSSGATGGGVIQDTASSATLVAVVAARERATAGASNARGVRDPLVVYASSEAHSSVEKAVRIAGIGSENLRKIRVDPGTLAMEPGALEAELEADRAAGLVPAAVIATVGTTGTTAIDPVDEVSRVCRDHEVWLHVDAAYAGTAALCPELRWIQAGVEGADSYCFNPHKWMLTNFDCDCLWVADRSALTAALSILPEYLRTRETGSQEVIDYRDWQIPLGRRFRALKLWFVVRHYGVSGLQAHVRHHVALAKDFATWVRADGRFEVPTPHPLSLVCFRLRADDDANWRLLDKVNEAGPLLTHTKVHDKVTLRVAIGATRTEHRHVERLWEIVRRCADEESKTEQIGR